MASFKLPQMKAEPRKIAKLGRREYTLGSKELGVLRDSSDVLHAADEAKWSELRGRLRQDGYLYIRGLLPRESVQAAKLRVLEHLRTQGMLADSAPVEEGCVGEDGGAQDQGRLTGADELSRTPEVLACLQHEQLSQFFTGLFAQRAVTYDYKWLRVVRPGECSGYHFDTVYMGNCKAPNLLTCWIPFMDVPAELGGLTVCRGSSSDEGFARVRDTYGRLDLDTGDVRGTGWFSTDPEEVASYGGQLETAEYSHGDVVVFSMHTMHGSAVNTTRRWRISCDVRWQPEDEPKDPRWFFDADGAIPGLSSRWVLSRDVEGEFPRTMEIAKQDWGLRTFKRRRSESPTAQRKRNIAAL